MRFTTALLSLLGCSMTLAAALPASSLDGGPELRPRLLTEDDIILFGNGHHQVMKRHEYEAIKAGTFTNTTIAPTPFPSVNGSTHKAHNGSHHHHASKAPLSERGCEQSSEIQVASITHFANWDVAMSSVVSADDAVASVSVTSGFSLANSVSVSAGVEVTAVEDLLKESFSISYSNTWTTSTTIAYTFVVAKGKSGLVISNPETTRYSGQYIYGCTDNPSYANFQSDVYTSATMNGLEWVEGKISLCSSTKYPVPYCVGTGTHL